VIKRCHIHAIGRIQISDFKVKLQVSIAIYKPSHLSQLEVLLHCECVFNTWFYIVNMCLLHKF